MAKVSKIDSTTIMYITYTMECMDFINLYAFSSAHTVFWAIALGLNFIKFVDFMVYV